MIKTQLSVILVCISISVIFAQEKHTLTLNECYINARKNAAQITQIDYQHTISMLEKRNSSNHLLPQLYLNGQASYQSDVITFPESPIQVFPKIPKDQYKLTLDLHQTLYDGGLTKNQMELTELQSRANIDAVEIELYQIYQVVHQLYFSTLLLDKNLELLLAKNKLLEEQEKTIKSRVENGVLLESELSQFKMQLLKLNQQITATTHDREATISMLGKWIGNTQIHEYKLDFPDAATIQTSTRPEITMYHDQQNIYEGLKNLQVAQRRPQLSLFGQAGIGQPNPFNFADTKLSDFYILGVKLNWKILDYGQAHRQKQVYEHNQLIINSKLQAFNEQQDRTIISEKASEEKLKELLLQDEELIQLQKSIVKSTYSKLQNGTTTSSQYLDELNEQTQLELMEQLHQIQLIENQHKQLLVQGIQIEELTQKNDE